MRWAGQETPFAEGGVLKHKTFVCPYTSVRPPSRSFREMLHATSVFKNSMPLMGFCWIWWRKNISFPSVVGARSVSIQVKRSCLFHHDCWRNPQRKFEHVFTGQNQVGKCFENKRGPTPVKFALMHNKEEGGRVKRKIKRRKCVLALRWNALLKLRILRTGQMHC